MGARRFKSVHHPGSLPWAAVYGRALVTPIATCMLPVMIITLVGVLEGVRVLPQAFWAAGAAIALASLWTSFKLRRMLAEIQIDEEWVRVLSVRDIVRDETERARRVLDVRDYGSWALATIGLSSYEIERRYWPAYDELIAALEASG